MPAVFLYFHTFLISCLLQNLSGKNQTVPREEVQPLQSLHSLRFEDINFISNIVLYVLFKKHLW